MSTLFSNSIMEPRRKHSLAEQVMHHLTACIQREKYKPGEKLPTEPELMSEMGVSRTVVREAISRLQAAGLVESRQGIGTFVLSQPFAKLPTDPSTLVTVRDVVSMLELRISFETEAASLAASRRTITHMQSMRKALDEYDAALARGETAIDADFQFHLQIARATGNRYFEDVMTYLGTATIPRTRFNTPSLSEQPSIDYLNSAQYDHHQVLEAIQRQDPESAREAMRTHLTKTLTRLGQLSAAEGQG